MKYKLILDFGNTLKKLAVFRGEELLEMRTTSLDVVTEIEQLKNSYRGLDTAILSTVVRIDIHLLQYLKSNFSFLLFDQDTPIPISNKYETPKTLGKDRLAAAIGAQLMFPAENVLVIDAGSSITYEFITKKGEYLGGAISPGLRLRSRALHEFTDQLPLVELSGHAELLGRNTLDCLRSGVLNGAIAELNSMIAQFIEQFGELKVILTGGDLKYFEKSLKYNIFASANLVLVGLNHILDFNEL
jgi:type III pantothenate kinase